MFDDGRRRDPGRTPQVCSAVLAALALIAVAVWFFHWLTA